MTVRKAQPPLWQQSSPKRKRQPRQIVHLPTHVFNYDIQKIRQKMCLILLRMELKAYHESRIFIDNISVTAWYAQVKIQLTFLSAARQVQVFSVSLDFWVLFYQEKRTKEMRIDITTS